MTHKDFRELVANNELRENKCNVLDFIRFSKNILEEDPKDVLDALYKKYPLYKAFLEEYGGRYMYFDGRDSKRWRYMDTNEFVEFDD